MSAADGSGTPRNIALQHRLDVGVEQRVGRAGVVGERKIQFVTPCKKALDFEL